MNKLFQASATYGQQMTDHLKANRSDPFAFVRMAKDINNGLAFEHDDKGNEKFCYGADRRP